jgi:signal transduction histidine kinase/ligand-binding sensor domain-containing protein
MAYSWRMGLSGGLNTAVCESPDGFLWIATNNGLIKFDGQHYQQIPAGPSSLPDNIVVSVAASPDGRSVWIGSFRYGVARFDVKTQKFRSYQKLLNYDTHIQSTQKILCLDNGQVWLGTGGMGLALYLPEKDTFQFFTPQPLSFYNGEPDLKYKVNDMTPDPVDSNRIWLVTNNEIYSFDTRIKEFTAYPLPAGMNVYFTSIAHNGHNGHNGLWLGTWGNSMFHYDTRIRQLSPLDYYNSKGQAERGMLALDVEQINDTTVLWACAFSGLLEHNPKTGKIRQALPTFKLDQSLDTRVEFTAISKTKNAGVFVGAKGYLFQLHPNYSRLGRVIVPAPWAPEDGIYTNNGVLDQQTRQYLIPAAGPLGLLAIGAGSFSSKPIPLKQPGNDNRLKELAQLPSGKIIAFGFDGNLFNLNLAKNTTEQITLPLNLNGSILEMKFDKKGFLWLLTRQNLYRFDAGTMTLLDGLSFLDFENPVEKPFSNLYLYQIETTSTGSVWVGSNQGLWLAEPGKKRLSLFHPQNKQGKWLKDKFIKSMAIDADDRMWVGYNGDGLDIFDTKKKEVVAWPQGAGMPAHQINDLACTPGGLVLATTTEGLLAIDRKTLDWQLFGTEDGLYSQFMDKDVWAAPDGMVFINHGTKLNVFHESALLVTQEKMKVNILRLTINNEEQDVARFLDNASYLTLPHSSNNIAVSFSAMHWLYPFKTQYLYRLRTESDSGEWVVGEEPFVQLNALRPGSYTLELGARGAGNTPSLPKHLHIEIRPPFWVRGWFLLFCAALLFWAGYALYSFRLAQLRKQAAVRDTISRNLHDDIGSSLSNIQILTELARRHLADREKAGTFLGRAGEDMRLISEALSEIVWNVNPKYDDLRFLFARMQRYAAESLEGKNIRHELVFPEESVRLKMGMEQRRDFYLIFKESIHNLVKYSGAGLATVKVEIQPHAISLEVKDDGSGFSKPEVRAGTGLSSMQQRAEKWKGKLEIISAPGEGTCVRLLMPL